MKPLRRRFEALRAKTDRQAEARLLDGWTVNGLLLDYQRTGALPAEPRQRQRVLEISDMLAAMSDSVPRVHGGDR